MSSGSWGTYGKQVEDVFGGPNIVGPSSHFTTPGAVGVAVPQAPSTMTWASSAGQPWPNNLVASDASLFQVRPIAPEQSPVVANPVSTMITPSREHQPCVSTAESQRSFTMASSFPPPINNYVNSATNGYVTAPRKRAQAHFSIASALTVLSQTRKRKASMTSEEPEYDVENREPANFQASENPPVNKRARYDAQDDHLTSQALFARLPLGGLVSQPSATSTSMTGSNSAAILEGPFASAVVPRTDCMYDKSAEDSMNFASQLVREFGDRIFSEQEFEKFLGSLGPKQQGLTTGDLDSVTSPVVSVEEAVPPILEPNAVQKHLHISHTTAPLKPVFSENALQQCRAITPIKISSVDNAYTSYDAQREAETVPMQVPVVHNNDIPFSQPLQTQLGVSEPFVIPSTVAPAATIIIPVPDALQCSTEFETIVAAFEEIYGPVHMQPMSENSQQLQRAQLSGPTPAQILEEAYRGPTREEIDKILAIAYEEPEPLETVPAASTADLVQDALLFLPQQYNQSTPVIQDTLTSCCASSSSGAQVTQDGPANRGVQINHGSPIYEDNPSAQDALEVHQFAPQCQATFFGQNTNVHQVAQFEQGAVVHQAPHSHQITSFGQWPLSATHSPIMKPNTVQQPNPPIEMVIPVYNLNEGYASPTSDAVLNLARSSNMQAQTQNQTPATATFYPTYDLTESYNVDTASVPDTASNLNRDWDMQGHYEALPAETIRSAYNLIEDRIVAPAARPLEAHGQPQHNIPAPAQASASAALTPNPYSSSKTAKPPAARQTRKKQAPKGPRKRQAAASPPWGGAHPILQVAQQEPVAKPENERTSSSAGWINFPDNSSHSWSADLGFKLDNALPQPSDQLSESIYPPPRQADDLRRTVAVGNACISPGVPQSAPVTASIPTFVTPTPHAQFDYWQGLIPGSRTTFLTDFNEASLEVELGYIDTQ